MNTLSTLTTEQRNRHSMNIDNLSTADILKVMNNEDLTVAKSVQMVLPKIEQAVNLVYESLSNDGRLIYVGAGTSGRLGILDAVECPPTFSTDPEMVQAIMAGGQSAFIEAVEGAEDKPSLGAEDLKDLQLSNSDVVIGIAASGRTPYVIGALKYANEIGARTVSISSNEKSLIGKHADVGIDVITGPEILTGSTRMKAATAHKLILNMISTSTMIKMGKVYENLMVDVKVSNYKLKQRAIGIICEVTSASHDEAEKVLELANLEVKSAIVMINADVDYETAKKRLKKANGFVRQAIDLA